MTVKEIDCGYADERDVAARYLAGGLPEAEAEEFEKHYFSCERCWGEVEQAGELRLAFGRPLVAPPESAAGRVRRDYWTPLAAAAVVAVLAVGLGRLAERAEVPQGSPVFRGSGTDVLALVVKPGPTGQVVLEWPPHPNAESYRIEVLRSDGVPVLRSETSDVTVVLDAGALPLLPPGVSLLARVEAMDAMGQIIASSVLKTLPAP